MPTIKLIITSINLQKLPKLTTPETMHKFTKRHWVLVNKTKLIILTSHHKTLLQFPIDCHHRDERLTVKKHPIDDPPRSGTKYARD